MFSLTSAAARQIQASASHSSSEDMALRVAARVAADGSMQYGMGFDEPKDEDLQLDLEGVTVVIGDESQALLADTVLDFVELEPGEFNFIFVDAQTAAEAASGAFGAAGCNTGGCGSGGCSSGGCSSRGATH